MKKIGIGIIGCGDRIRVLLDLILSKSKSVEVLGLYDPSPCSIAKTQQTAVPSAAVYQNYKDMLKNPSIDWVMIGSWNCFHKEQIIASLSAGKNVFCEKPLATTLQDCIAINEAVKKTDKLFTIGFTLRYSPHYRKIKEVVSSGQIGEIISFEFNETLPFDHGGYILGNWRRLRKNAGSHILEKCCHDIDIANWIIDSKVIKVASFGGLNFFKPQNTKYMEVLAAGKNGKKAYTTWLSDTDPDPFNSDKTIVDNQVIIFEYQNGVRATFHTNLNSGIPERRFYVCGTGGAVRADVISGVLELRKTGFDEKIQDLSTGASGCHGGGDDVLVKELLDSMLYGTMPKTGIKEGLMSAATCFGIDQAMDNSCVVEMSDIWENFGY